MNRITNIYLLSWFSLGLFLLVARPCLAQSIVFEKVDKWTKTFDKAKRSSKYVFVYGYSSVCYPCKSVDQNIFNDEDLIKNLNAGFINVKIDLDSPAGKDLVIKHKLSVNKSYPVFLFLSGNGQVHQVQGYPTAAVIRNDIDEVVEKFSTASD